MALNDMIKTKYKTMYNEPHEYFSTFFVKKLGVFTFDLHCFRKNNKETVNMILSRQWLTELCSFHSLLFDFLSYECTI